MWKKAMGDEKGSVMVMVVLGLVVLLGFTGLVIDGGRGYLTKAQLQTAADAAALAGAQQLPTLEPTVETAITYAGHNGMIPDFTDASPVDSDTYIASSSGDTVQVDYIESTEFTTLEDMYTPEEEGQMVALESARLINMSLTELMAEAALYSISYDTVGGYTEGQLAAMSNLELLNLAKANSVTAGLTTKSISSMTEPELRQCASDNGYSIPAKYLSGEMIKEGSVETVKGLLITYLGGDQGSIVIDKTALIASLLVKLNEAISPATLRAAILAQYGDELAEAQKVVNQGHPDRVRVTCSRSVRNTFMSVLGFRTSTVSATAVAEWRVWNGEALPFVNMDDMYSEDPDIGAWETITVSAGNKERIHDDVIDIPSDTVISLTVMDDGEGEGPYMYMKGGFDVGSELPDPLENIVVVGNNVYLLSLRADLLDEDSTYADSIGNINKYHLPMADLVLLKCIVNEDWYSPGKTCYLTFVEAYDWDDVKNTFVMGAPPRLVE